MRYNEIIDLLDKLPEDMYKLPELRSIFMDVL